jgi:NADH-quinone oxidoreductase subunit N
VRVDLAAVLPELLLTALICAVLTIDLFLPKDRKGLLMPLSLLGVVATLAAVISLAGTNRVTLSGMFVVDRFALLFKVVFCISAALVIVMSHDYLKDDEIHQGEYYTMLLCSLLGMLTIASSRDLISIFVSLELISLPAFVLAGVRKNDLRSNEAALKFFIFGVLSTTVMLFGMSLIYGLTGSTRLSAISTSLAAEGPSEIAVLAIFFIVVGFGFKISAFPFQWWVPDTYEGSPVPIAAFLSVASKTAGFVGLLQTMFVGFGPLAGVWRPFFGLLGVATMTFGNLVAIQQKHIVRLLAYSSIAQAGYILLPLGVASANRSANSNVLFASVAYLLVYAFMETGAFAAVIAFGRKGGGYQVEDYSGLFSRSPALAVGVGIFLLSLAGIFPLAGWWAKFVVFKALASAFVNGYTPALWYAAAMAVNTVIALFYYAAIVKRMFFDIAAEAKAILVPPFLAGAIAATAVVVVAGGILPDVFGQLAGRSIPF